jgi:hypothetical protein
LRCARAKKKGQTWLRAKSDMKVAKRAKRAKRAKKEKRISFSNNLLRYILYAFLLSFIYCFLIYKMKIIQMKKHLSGVF